MSSVIKTKKFYCYVGVVPKPGVDVGLKTLRKLEEIKPEWLWTQKMKWKFQKKKKDYLNDD